MLAGVAVLPCQTVRCNSLEGEPISGQTMPMFSWTMGAVGIAIGTREMGALAHGTNLQMKDGDSEFSQFARKNGSMDRDLLPFNRHFRIPRALFQITQTAESPTAVKPRAGSAVFLVQIAAIGDGFALDCSR
jgi:hypothetical protein